MDPTKNWTSMSIMAISYIKHRKHSLDSPAGFLGEGGNRRTWRTGRYRTKPDKVSGLIGDQRRPSGLV